MHDWTETVSHIPLSRCQFMFTHVTRFYLKFIKIILHFCLLFLCCTFCMNKSMCVDGRRAYEPTMMLLIGIWMSLTKNPMKPMIQKPMAVAIAIFWNSRRSGFVQRFTKRSESLANKRPGSQNLITWSILSVVRVDLQEKKQRKCTQNFSRWKW